MVTRPSVPSPREIWEEAHRHVKTYDLVGFADMFAADGVMELPFAPPGVPGRFEGRDAIRRFLAPAAEAARKSGRRILGYRNVVFHETLDPQVIVVEFDLHGAGPNDEPYCFSYIQVMRTRDREIVHLRDYIDPRLFRGDR
jgi:ketosteroid isomerase-like protein